MELEIKHIAAYLPYALEMHCAGELVEDRPYILELTGISKDDGIIWLYAKAKKNNYVNSLVMEDCFPILRPLLDLTKEIEVNGETFEFTDLFEYGDDEDASTKQYWGVIDKIKEISKHNIQHDIDWLPVGVVNKMIELHFDVFGLIEAKLAIDINTIK